MSLPKDANMLYCVINTKLRDFYSSLDALCEDLGEDKQSIIDTLKNAGFEYDSENNRFV